MSDADPIEEYNSAVSSLLGYLLMHPHRGSSDVEVLTRLDDVNKRFPLAFGAAEALRSEVARLRQWQDEAMTALLEWEDVWVAAGRPGELGRTKAAGVFAKVDALHQWQQDACRLFEEVRTLDGLGRSLPYDEIHDLTRRATS